MKTTLLSLLGLTLSCAAWAAPAPPHLVSHIRLTTTIANGETGDPYLLINGPAPKAAIQAVRESWAGTAQNSAPCVLEMKIENVPADFGDWQDQDVFETPRCIRN